LYGNTTEMSQHPDPSNPPSELEKELVRQGERTVDNLKRLFAFMFAISFAVLANSAIEKFRPLLTNPDSVTYTWKVWLLNAELFSVFVVTAGVFYHQAVKFLDNRYARHPIAEVHPLGFAMDYLTLTITMVPFFFMAHSLNPSVTHAVGYTWYFGFYILLLSAGLILLINSQIRHSEYVRTHMFKEKLADSEIAREGTLRIYWFLMNSFFLLVILLLFWLSVQRGIAWTPVKRSAPSVMD
jgi:protein-S-isoprenylcysteine O-methyltransferase Ste14